MLELEYLKTLIRNRESDDTQKKLIELAGPSGVASALGGGPAGLSGPQVEASRTNYGRNRIDPPKPVTYLKFLRDAFGDITVLVLCGAAFVSLLMAILVEKSVTAYAESAAILVAIMVVTAVNDWRGSFYV